MGYHGSGLEGIYYCQQCADSGTKTSNQYSSFSGTRVKGRKVISSSIWPLLPNSLDCGQNIYRGNIKVIHPYRNSWSFENSVNMKHGLLSFYPSSFFTRTEKRQVPTISSISSLDLRNFCRFSVRLLLMTLIIQPIFDFCDPEQHLAAK